MAINLGPTFEQAVAALAGYQPGDYEEGSLDIPFVNPTGNTTVRITTRVDIDSEQLGDLIRAAAPASDPGE